MKKAIYGKYGVLLSYPEPEPLDLCQYSGCRVITASEDYDQPKYCDIHRCTQCDNYREEDSNLCSECLDKLDEQNGVTHEP